MVIVEWVKWQVGPASFGGAKEIMSQVRVTATDAAVSIGECLEASGPALSLLLALTGRRAALADLVGPGIDSLAKLT